MAKEFHSFEEFWPFYLGEHSLSLTRSFHFIGTTLGLLSLLAGIVTLHWWFLIVGLAISYGFAWISHFFIEKNRPATFKYPIYSFLGDFRMYGLMWRGRMAAELKRLGIAQIDANAKVNA